MKVIDTLSEGFGAANRRIWIIVIPILFDVFLWLGPKATLGPHLAQMVQADLPAPYSGYEQLVQQIVAGFNIFSLAATYLIPSLVAKLDSTPLVSVTSDLAVNSPLAFVALTAGTVLVGLWLGCLYMGLVAQVVRDGHTDLRVLVVAVWRYWRRLIAFLLLVMLILAAVAMPFGLAYVLLSSVSPDAGQFLALLVEIAVIWSIVYLYFTLQALLLSDAGPVQAIRLSVAVIASNFWAAITLIGLTFLITIGLPIAWQLIATHPAGLAVAIIGNAYIGTGVAAAGFLFYQERLERLKAAAQTRQEIR